MTLEMSLNLSLGLHGKNAYCKTLIVGFILESVHNTPAQTLQTPSPHIQNKFQVLS